MSLVDVALAYVADRRPVFPLRPRSKLPWAGSHGFKDATLDPELVRGWWAGCPDSNIGIPTGTPSGIVVVDVDGPAAQHALDELAGGRQLGGLVARTPNGWQRWYEAPADVTIRNSQSRLARGVDVRGDGGYTVAPPSVREGGRRYAFVDGELEPLPTWLLHALTEQRSLAGIERASRPAGDYDRSTTPYGRAVLARNWGLVRWAHPSGREPTEPNRHHALFRAAFTVAGYVAGGQINRQEAEATLLDAALAAGLQGADDLRRQIRNAFEGNESRDGGLDHPLYPPPSRLERIRTANSLEEIEEALRT